ncbi:MAG TPA: right-handed parallel beta-helix repeat-containing protein [Gemmatimonadaceae bacterium]
MNSIARTALHIALVSLVPVAASTAQSAARPEAPLPTVELRPGMVITRSVRVVPKTYRLRAPASLDTSVITIRGDSITVDFAGATLEGQSPSADPDHAAGVAIRIDGGHDVRILNAKVRGYKVGVLARGARGLTLADNDLSYNWKPRLYSLVEHESLVDWLSFHHNEHDEWLRYGAAIYLADVSGGVIRGNTVEQGMNALMLVRSDSLRIESNTFSFNTGLGIGLYRSSFNTIMHNRADYDVRGYSEGFYHRGQDSADLLMFEQCSHNVVAYNSMTHGGDGLFLWAGQHTMDTGLGGANDNLFYGNDFSFAPANGMEATFSRNAFIANRVEGSDYGLWGGYSHDSKVIGNVFVRNRTGIAIEHGQDNVIASNVFDGDSTAIWLFGAPVSPTDSGYPMHHDSRSRDYDIRGNVFASNRVGVRASNTTHVAITDNRFANIDSLTVLRDTSGYRFDADTTLADAASIDVEHAMPPLPRDVAAHAPAPLPGGIRPARSPMERRDRASIIVDEWGPYDWRSPKLWPVDSTHALPLHLAVLGPPGTWRVVARRGIASLSRTSGRMDDTIAVTPRRDATGDWSLTLEYRGQATVSPRGEHHAAGEPVRFSYDHFEPVIAWTARLFTWNASTDPRAHASSFAELLHSTPIVTQHVSRLDYEGYGRLTRCAPADHVALEATGAVQLAPGAYTLRAISDDAVRVWVDGTLAIDHWTPHESALDFASLSGGRHTLRVQYYQVDGWNELRVEIVRGVQRSLGTPGTPAEH